MSANDDHKPELRLTPTTLRRVVLQRDKLAEEVEELKSENERLKEELSAHALCRDKIAALEAKAASGGAQSDDLLRKVEGLEKKAEDLALALKVSEQMRKRFEDRAVKVEALEAELAALRARTAAAEAGVEAAKAGAKKESAAAKAAVAEASQGPTPAEFFAAIEMFKAEQLMACISERVFVHVVAPKTILQVLCSSAQDSIR